MTKILFVCYRHGCKGEGLSLRLSQHSFFKTLEADIVNDRTIITNDVFNKGLLFRDDVLPKVPELTVDSNIVVPSHHFYDTMKNYVPNSYFISIDVPTSDELDNWRELLYNRYWTYKTKNILELTGECASRYYQIYPEAKRDDVMSFTAKVLKMKNVTFGDIICLGRDVEPTEENKRMLLSKYEPTPLSEETKKNSFVIPYKKIKEVNVEEIINYIK